MQENTSIQQRFIQEIREKIPLNVSLVEEISEALNISSDSAYRRIRGDKQLSLDETCILCLRYGISLDSHFHTTSNSITFRRDVLNEESFDLKQYLLSLLEYKKYIQDYDKSEILYNAKEIPIFHHFHIPEIALFKMFFWRKTMAQFPSYEQKLFSLKDADTEILELGKQLLMTFVKIPTLEIWSDETVTSFLKQIDFYLESGTFREKEDALILCDKLSCLIAHIQKQAELGYKFPYGTAPAGKEENFKLLYNEIVLSDMIILANLEKFRFAYFVYSTTNYFITTNEAFCNETERSLKQLAGKSALISGVGEKVRNKVFRALQDKVSLFKERIK